MATHNRVREKVHIIARWLAGAVTAGLVAAVSSGCGDPPTAPKVNSPAPAALTLTAVSPTTGPAAGGTKLVLNGTGFVSGAIVTIGGVGATVTAVTATAIAATTAGHAEGVVAVVVTNPDGRSASLAEAFTYEPDPVFPAPTITSVSPTIGSTAGGTYISIKGTGFRSGMAVIVDGVRTQVNVFQEGTVASVRTVAHAEGPVDVVVENTDGKWDTLRNGYTFAPPQSFDLDGDWAGEAGDHWDYDLQFTIRDKAVIKASCNGSPLVPASPAVVEAGRFSVVDDGVIRMTGEFTTAGYGLGTINISLCAGINWYAYKVVPSAAR